MKTKKIGTLNDKMNAKQYIEFIKTQKIPFVVSISNYTTKISAKGLRISMFQDEKRQTCFAAFQKVKSDVLKKEKPVVPDSRVIYFDHDFQNDINVENVGCIDIRSAYATTLLRNDFISEDTYKYLQKINKQDRLASVGMLASCRYEFYYDENGELQDSEIKESGLKSFFYFAVSEVYKIMSELRKICADKYLFTWVDCIYMREDEELLKRCCKYLSEINYSYKVEFLRNFRIRFKREKIKADFWKETKRVCNYKYFNIPQKENEFTDDVINYLINKKQNNENDDV